MTQEDVLFLNRMAELSNRSWSRSCWTYSEFLTLAQQDILYHMKKEQLPSGFMLEGGFEGAERRIAVFGSEESCGYLQKPPVCWVKISPLQQKFAQELSHRDLLGALMSLGMRRAVLGDIIIHENCGYLFCLNTAAEEAQRELTSVSRTSVRCEKCDKPAAAVAKPEEAELVAASERVDALIASAFKLSRADSKELFSLGKVFINSAPCTDASKEPRTGDIISVRGMGRIEYCGVVRETKKGRLRVTARIYK